MVNNLSNIENALRRANALGISKKTYYLLTYFKDSIEELRQIINILIADANQVVISNGVTSASYFYISIEKLTDVGIIYITHEAIDNRIEVTHHISSRTKFNRMQILEMIATCDISISTTYHINSLQECILSDLKQLNKQTILSKVYQMSNMDGYTTMRCYNTNVIGLKNLLCSVGETKARDILKQLTYSFSSLNNRTLTPIEYTFMGENMYFYMADATDREITNIRWCMTSDRGEIYQKGHHSLVISIPSKYIGDNLIESLSYATIYCKLDELVLYCAKYRKNNYSNIIDLYRHSKSNEYNNDAIENISTSNVYVTGYSTGMALCVARHPSKYKWSDIKLLPNSPVLSEKFNKLKCVYNRELDNDTCDINDLLFWSKNGN